MVARVHNGVTDKAARLCIQPFAQALQPWG